MEINLKLYESISPLLKTDNYLRRKIASYNNSLYILNTHNILIKLFLSSTC